PVGRLDLVLDGLNALSGGRVRLWRFDGRGLRLSAGADPGWAPDVPAAAGAVATPTGAAWLAPVAGVDGFWLEVGGDGDSPRTTAERIGPVVAALLAAERDRAFAAEELTSRYEEIDLLYAISEILGQTVRLEQAAQTIVREVSSVVGARRASIMVYDEDARLLRTVAARGFPDDGHVEVNLDDPDSIAARVFRDGRVVMYDPVAPGPSVPPPETGQGYRGEANMSVLISFAATWIST